MIVDSQIHCFQGGPKFPPPRDFEARHGARFTVDDALSVMGRNGVDRAILVPLRSWHAEETLNQYSIEAARKHPDRFAVMGQIDLSHPAAPGKLQRWREDGMLGIRQYFFPQADPLRDAAHEWFWRGLVEYDLPLMSAAPGNMSLYEPILDRYPQLRLVIDHAGRRPYDTGPGVWNDLDETLRLARFKNVSIKVSSLPCFSEAPYPFLDIHPYIRRIYDAFGPGRMMWGSDVTRLSGRYRENLDLFQAALDFLSADDKLWILGRSAVELCRWDRL